MKEELKGIDEKQLVVALLSEKALNSCDLCVSPILCLALSLNMTSWTSCLWDSISDLCWHAMPVTSEEKQQHGCHVYMASSSSPLKGTARALEQA